MNRFSVATLGLILISACFVIAIRHENRLVFSDLQKIEQDRKKLQVEWGRLMLEKATWSTQHNIADDARKRLKMSPPTAENIVTLQRRTDS